MTRWKPDAPGRLQLAAIELFDEQGYEATTVAEIAARAGLSKRTFFRHFADKREVLFAGGEEFAQTWLAGVTAAPAGLGALETACAGFGPVAATFPERHAFARLRNRIIAENPELLERELIKLQRLAGAITAELRNRGIADGAAVLAGQTAVSVFHVGFRRWVLQDDADTLAELLDAALAELREVAAGPVATTTI